MVKSGCCPIWRVTSVLLCAAVALGCGGTERRPAVQISGVVTLDGEPLSAGSIQFTSSKTGEAAYTNLGPGGEYRIEFPQADIGAEYQVTVGPPQDADLDATAIAQNPPEQLGQQIPMKYRDRTTSGLTVVIESDGANTFDFELRSQ